MNPEEAAPTRNPDLTPNLAEPVFDHEKLEVYQAAISFCGWAGELIERLPRIAVRDQLDRASTSIPLNIAEGNAKFSTADRSRFFEMARGSAVECGSCLDVLVARKHLARGSICEPKEQLAAITRMLVGLLKRFSPRAELLQEDPIGHGNVAASDEREHEHAPEHHKQ